MPVSHCAAEGCQKRVPPELLLCGPHWRLLPGDLQTDVWRTWRSGRGVGSVEYERVVAAAVGFVARVEGRGVHA